MAEADAVKALRCSFKRNELRQMFSFFHAQRQLKDREAFCLLDSAAMKTTVIGLTASCLICELDAILVRC